VAKSVCMGENGAMIIKPIVEAILLVERKEDTEGGRLNLYGLWPPVMKFGKFPTKPLSILVYVRFRELQSVEEALSVEIVATYGLTGREWARLPVFSREVLDGLTPALAVSSTVNFPPGRFKGPDTVVYKVLFRGEEIARTMLEIQALGVGESEEKENIG